MPRSTREWAKRELEYSVKNLDWVGTHVYKVAERYKEEHPEISEPLEVALTALEEIQTLIAKVRTSF